MPELVVRPVQEADFAELSQILEARERELYAGFGTQRQLQDSIDTFCSPQYLLGLSSEPDCVVLCAESAGRPVGIGALHLRGRTL